MAEYKIYSYTIVRNTMVQFVDKLPYCAALVEDENGKKYPAIIEGVKDGADISIGQAVTCVEEEGSPKRYCLAQ